MPPLAFNPTENIVPDIAKPKQLFVPMEQVDTVKNTMKKYIFSSVKDKFKDLFVGKETYTREPDSTDITIPKVTATRKDIYSPVHTLDIKITKEGQTTDKAMPVEVRTPPKRLQDTLNVTYQNNTDIPKGLLEALLMKESSMGSNATNKNSKIGDYAYLVGFTPVAKAELIRNGIIPDLNTPQGVLQATADYIRLKKDIKDVTGNVIHTYNNWTKFYNERFSSGKLKQSDLDTFNAYMNYYASK